MTPGDWIHTLLFVLAWLYVGCVCASYFCHKSLTFRRIVILCGPLAVPVLLVVGAFNKILDMWYDE